MVQINGKYKLVENRNFYECLRALGVPEEKAKSDSEIKGFMEVTLDGNNITMANPFTYVRKLIIGQAVEETTGGDTIVKSTTRLDGNVITVTLKSKDGASAGSRIYTFSDAGLEVVITIEKDGKSISTTRIYQRI